MKLDITDKELNQIMESVYKIGFSDSYHYMVTRDFLDTPVSTGFYSVPVLRDIGLRLRACDEADERENLYGNSELTQSRVDDKQYLNDN